VVRGLTVSLALKLLGRPEGGAMAIVNSDQNLREDIEINNPWALLFGLFKDDPDFAEIAAEIRAIRESDDESEVDPSAYELAQKSF
jgi:hypothetical protein